MPQSPTASPTLGDSHWLVIALVGATCTIFLLFNYCRVLERHCCAFRGINFSRNQEETRFLDENNADDSSLQFQSRGLDSYVMHSLPISQFKKKNEEELSQSNTDCAVCLGEFEEGELIKHLPNCSHAFHVSCIDTWFQDHSNCPLCRSHVFDQAMHHEYSLSMYTLLETLRREDFLRERSTQYQVLRSHILQNFSSRINPQNAS